MSDSPKQQILKQLDGLNLSYEVHEHEPIYTVEEGRKIAASIDSLCCKSLFVKNKKKQYFLVVIESNKRFDSKSIAKQLGSGHLSFADEEELKEKLNTFAGAVSLLGLLFNKEKDVMPVIDKEVLSAEFIDLHPCTNDCSLKIPVYEILTKFIPATGRTYQSIDVV